jgi:hypothetical protein
VEELECTRELLEQMLDRGKVDFYSEANYNFLLLDPNEV